MSLVDDGDFHAEWEPTDEEIDAAGDRWIQQGVDERLDEWRIKRNDRIWFELGRHTLRSGPPQGSRSRGPSRAPRRVVRVARRRAAARSSPRRLRTHEPDLARRRRPSAGVAA